ncbi:MAG: hypothetical protein JWO67_1133 [Streptosporangiaceae bacterium]|jgi:hypothetical protein|nr:hypothetical protein [Streptosporangiaceae bacterium]
MPLVKEGRPPGSLLELGGPQLDEGGHARHRVGEIEPAQLSSERYERLAEPERGIGGQAWLKLGAPADEAACVQNISRPVDRQDAGQSVPSHSAVQDSPVCG